MTKISVSGYDDLRGDEVLSSRQRDLVLDALDAGPHPAVARLPDWLAQEKSLDPIESVDTLFAGRLIHETEKAYLFTTSLEVDPDADRPGTDWLPKSQVRVYEAASDDLGDERAHHTMDDFV